MARPFKFKHPDEVWKLYQDYLNHIANTPMYRNELIKSGERAGEQIPVRVDVPPNIWGFCLFAGINRQTYYKYLNGKEEDNIDKKLTDIFTRVDDDIKQKQITGAAVNLYNANIVARLNSLKDVQQVESTNQEQIVININGSKVDLSD
jgi:hypothetical protein